MATTTQTATPDAGTTQTGADQTTTAAADAAATGATGSSQSSATPAPKTPDPIAGRMKAIQNKHRRQTAELLDRIAKLEAASAGPDASDDDDDDAGTTATAAATAALAAKPDAAATAAADAAAHRLDQKLKNREKELSLAKAAQVGLRNKLAELQYAALAPNSADPKLVSKLAMENSRVTDAGEIEVLDDKGEVRYSDVTGEPMTPDEHVAEILVAKPYLAGGQPRAGVPGGVTPAAGTQTAATIDTKIKAATAAGNYKLANSLRMQKAVALGRAQMNK